MKQIIKIIIVMLGLLAIISLPACGGGGSGGGGSDGSGGGGGVTFSTPDLEGTWLHLLKGSTTWGSVTVDIDGNVVGGIYDQIYGSNDGTYTSFGAFSINTGGNILGSLTTDIPSSGPYLVSGPTLQILSGQMSRDKGLFAFASTDPDDKMGLLIKSVTGFSQSDLNGQWSFGNQNGYGTFTYNSSTGIITAGSYTRETGSPASSTSLSGTLTVTGGGGVPGTFNIGTVNYNIVDGQMNLDKNVLYITLTDNLTGADNAFVAVKMNASFGIDDAVTTTFRIFSFGDNTAVGYGSFTLDISGNATGSLNRIGVGSETFLTGNVGINPDGTITPGGTINSDSKNYVIHWGQISATKNFSFVVSTVSTDSGPIQNGTEVILFIRQ